MDELGNAMDGSRQEQADILKPIWLPAALSVAALIVFFAGCLEPLRELTRQWGAEEYSHGPVIPVLAVFLSWHLLTEKPPVPRPSWWGGVAFFAGALLLLVGELSTFYQIALYGMFLALAGFVLSVLGVQAFRTIFPAFFYLFFAIPLPRMIYNSLSSDLQLISSTLGVDILDLLDFPVFQEGNIIDLGNYKLQVVEACSGLRYLFPLMSFGYLAAFMMKDRMWKRVVVFLSAVPITIGMNSFRIAMIGVTVNVWGIGMAGGVLHDFEGWTIFLACALILLGEVWCLNRLFGRGSFNIDYFSFAHGPVFARPLVWKRPATALLAGAVGVFALSLFVAQVHENAIVPPHRNLEAFPLSLSGWVGQPDTIERGILDELKVTDYWIANYHSAAETGPVNFYIAYYEAQQISTSVHSPSTCIPGGGWRIIENEPITLSADQTGGELVRLSRIVIQQGDQRQLVYYWFDERGRDIVDQFSAKWYLMVDSVEHHRTDGALIRLVTPIPRDEDVKEADKRLQRFVRNFLPISKTFLPAPPAGI